MPSRPFRFAAVAAITALIAACGDVGPIPAPLRFSFDSRGAATPTVFSVTNVTRHTIYVARCGDHFLMELQRLDDDTWVNAMSGFCLAVARMDPIPLSPGESRADSLLIANPGRYRFRVGVAGEPGAATDYLVTSPGFDIE